MTCLAGRGGRTGHALKRWHNAKIYIVLLEESESISIGRRIHISWMESGSSRAIKEDFDPDPSTLDIIFSSHRHMSRNFRWFFSNHICPDDLLPNPDFHCFLQPDLALSRFGIKILNCGRILSGFWNMVGSGFGLKTKVTNLLNSID